MAEDKQDVDKILEKILEETEKDKFKEFIKIYHELKKIDLEKLKVEKKYIIWNNFKPVLIALIVSFTILCGMKIYYSDSSKSISDHNISSTVKSTDNNKTGVTDFSQDKITVINNLIDSEDVKKVVHASTGSPRTGKIIRNVGEERCLVEKDANCSIKIHCAQE